MNTISAPLRYANAMKRSKPPRGKSRASMGATNADGRMLGEMLRQTVRDQIKANEPAEVGATYRRLIAEGQDQKNAIELITAVLAAEMYDIMNIARSTKSDTTSICGAFPSFHTTATPNLRLTSAIISTRRPFLVAEVLIAGSEMKRSRPWRH